MQVKIDGNTYHVHESWDSFDLEKGIELTKLTKQIPAKLKEIYDLLTVKQTPDVKDMLNRKYKKLTEKDYIKTFPIFYGKILKCLSDIPQSVVNKCLWEYRTVFYQKYLEKFVIGVMYAPVDIELKTIKSFEHDGVEYFLPETRLKMGEEVPMAGAQTLEFTEAADLQLLGKDTEAGQYHFAANIIAILARPKGEEYDEDTSLERAPKFNNLPMQKALEVFFSSIEHFNIYYQSILKLGIQRELEAQRHLKNQDSSGLVGTPPGRRSLVRESSTHRALRLYNQLKGQTPMTSFTTWLQNGRFPSLK